MKEFELFCFNLEQGIPRSGKVTHLSFQKNRLKVGCCLVQKWQKPEEGYKLSPFWMKFRLKETVSVAQQL